MPTPGKEAVCELLRAAIIMEELNESILNPSLDEIRARAERFCVAADQVCPDQREFSRRVFVTQSTVSKWRRGQLAIRPHNALAFESATRINHRYILCGETPVILSPPDRLRHGLEQERPSK